MYCSVSLTGAFGGLLATAIHSLDGTHGISGWRSVYFLQVIPFLRAHNQLRWIFIVEGCITAGLGLLSLIFMSAYPNTASWLSPTERDIVLLTNEADRALKPTESFSGAEISSAFKDWRTYVWSLMYIGTYIPVYSVILSLPSVVAGLGYKGTHATLMAYPPYGLGFIVVLLVGWSTDKYGHRYWHCFGGIVVTMTALIVLMIARNLVVRYIMFFFVMFM